MVEDHRHAHYEPFPTFAEWTSTRLSLDQWDYYLNLLTEERGRASEEDFAAAREVALRAAAVDTGAIEGLYPVDRGFTMTVARQAAKWQYQMNEKGEHVRDLFAAQLDGLQLILDAVTKKQPISEAFIREIHARLTSAQKTYSVLTDQGWQVQLLPHGEYKKHPNNPFSADERQLFAYAAPLDVGSEMHRLVVELTNQDFENAHAITQAGYAHYSFVKIHPFADGNGRVARALSSLFLLRSASIPLVVFADQRVRYLEALEAADRGTFNAFNGFVLDAAVDTMQLARDFLKHAHWADRHGDLEFFRGVEAQHGLKPGEIDQLATRVLAEFREQAEAALARLSLPQLELQFLQQDDSRGAPRGHRVIARKKGQEVIILRNRGEGGGDVTGYFRVLPVTTSKIPHLLTLEMRFANDADNFEVRPGELVPHFSEGLRYRTQMAADTLIRRMLAILRERTGRSLVEKGWSPMG